MLAGKKEVTNRRAQVKVPFLVFLVYKEGPTIGLV